MSTIFFYVELAAKASNLEKENKGKFIYFVVSE